MLSTDSVENKLDAFCELSTLDSTCVGDFGSSKWFSPIPADPALSGPVIAKLQSAVPPFY
jgi:hypothetical protein